MGDIINLLTMIIGVLVFCLILMFLMNTAKKSDEKNNRGTPETRSDGSGFKAIIFVGVIMLAIVIWGYTSGLPYKSPVQEFEEFIEMMKNGSFENFRRLW